MTFNNILHVIIFNIKKILLFSFILTILFAIIVYIAYPISYTAETTVLPPADEENSSLSSLLAGGDISNFLGAGGAKGNSMLNAEILKSRSISEAVIKQYNLLPYLKTKNIHLGAAILSNKISSNVSKEGILTFSVEFSTPLFGRFLDIKDSIRYLVPQIANGFIKELNKINTEKMNIRAKSSREYVEFQLSDIKTKMDSSETALKTFQNKYKAISLPEQLTAAIENAAKLKSDIVTTEIELNTLKLNVSNESQAYQSLSKKLDILKSKYNQFETGESEKMDYLPAFNNVPDIVQKYAELTRDVKIYNEVYLFLQKQYFKEKIQENKDASNVQVLDEAIVPLSSSGPRVLFSTLAFAVFAFLSLSLVEVFKNKNLYKK